MLHTPGPMPHAWLLPPTKVWSSSATSGSPASAVNNSNYFDTTRSTNHRPQHVELLPLPVGDIPTMECLLNLINTSTQIHIYYTYVV